MLRSVQLMATCSTCGADTQLYLNGVPICIPCVDKTEAARKPSTKAQPTTPELGKSKAV